MNARQEWRIAIRDAQLDVVAKLVGFTLDTYMDAQGIGWPSRRSLADTTGYTLRTIERAVARLERAGLIIVMRGVGRRSNTYYAAFPYGVPGDATSSANGVPGDATNDRSGESDDTKTPEKGLSGVPGDAIKGVRGVPGDAITPTSGVPGDAIRPIPMASLGTVVANLTTRSGVPGDARTREQVIRTREEHRSRDKNREPRQAADAYRPFTDQPPEPEVDNEALELARRWLDEHQRP